MQPGAGASLAILPRRLASLSDLEPIIWWTVRSTLHSGEKPKVRMFCALMQRTPGQAASQRHRTWNTKPPNGQKISRASWHVLLLLFVAEDVKSFRECSRTTECVRGIGLEGWGVHALETKLAANTWFYWGLRPPDLTLGCFRSPPQTDSKIPKNIKQPGAHGSSPATQGPPSTRKGVGLTRS